MAKELTTESEALDELTNAVNAVIGKRWMFALWTVTDDDKGVPKTVTLEKRLTWKFPAGDFNVAMDQLRSSIDDETEALVPPVPPPLKMADFGVEEVPLERDVAKELLEREEKEEVEVAEKGDKPKTIGEMLQMRERGI
jgi:hypothetical protein